MSIQTAPAYKDERSLAADQTQPAPKDRAYRDALLLRIADHPHLPRPPGLVLQVLERASRLDCSPADLASVIHCDPVLCGKILKTVNSALFGLPRAVTSVERAIAVLGLKPVRSLVLGLSLPAMQRQANCQPPVATFWKESVAGAIVAHELALRLQRPHPGDELVAGLLRDLGMLALHQVFSSEYATLLQRPLVELARYQCQLEEQQLGISHSEVSAFLLDRWRLPREITDAIRCHHAPEQAAELSRSSAERARLLAFASRVAQLQLGGEAVLLYDILHAAHDHFGMSEADLTAFLEPVADKIADFAALMDLNIGTCDHYPRILARAAEELVKLTVETSVDQWRILEQKQQAEQEKQHWRAQAHRFQHEARRDPLTDAYHRGHFDEELSLMFRRSQRRGTVLGLIFLDLDDFKKVNDRFGHLFGDRVLKETADLLYTVVRQGDVVARYGGDEFCLLVENTSPDGMRAMTDRLRQNLDRRTLHEGGQTIPLRASLGAVLCLPRTYPHSSLEFLAEADKAAYSAKSAGKNQVVLVSLLSDADRRWLQAMQDRQFSNWLAKNGEWQPDQLGAGVRRTAARFEAPGRLARRLGWLSEEQRGRLLREQRATRRRFDEIAVERGYLTSQQLSALLALQREPPEVLAANLVNLGVAGEAELREELRKHYRWLRSFSDLSLQ